MEFNWSTLKPRDQIQVWQPSWISNLHLQSLVQLYQPFIGGTATNLYLSLFYEISPQTFHSDSFALMDLLATLDVGIKEFYQARTRLEGIGLLKTFASTKVEDYASYRLELLAPLSPNLFFKDPLMATLLMDRVNRTRFMQLQRRFAYLKPVDEKEAPVDITKPFEEVYQAPFNVSSYSQKMDSSNQVMVSGKETSIPIGDNANFDWDYLKSLLSSRFVPQDALTEQVKVTIRTLHSYYGLSEQDLVPYIVHATDTVQREINLTVLKNSVVESMQEMQKKQVKLGKEREKHQEEIQAKNFNEAETLRATVANKPIKDGIHLDSTKAQTSVEERLIEAAEKFNPYQFTSDIKEQKGGFVANHEQRTIRDLLEISKLPAPVVNILVYYLLVMQNNANITKNLADTIANDWAQKKIVTAQDAIASLKMRGSVQQKEKEQRMKQTAGYQKGTYSNQRKPVRVEVVPEWAKSENKTVEKPLDDAEYKRMQERIQRLKTGRETSGND